MELDFSLHTPAGAGLQRVTPTTPLPVTNSGGEGAGARADSSLVTRDAFNAADHQMIAARTNRKGFTIYNNGDQTLYVNMSAGVTSAVFKSTTLAVGGFLDMSASGYTGPVRGMWSAAGTGGADITEFF